MNRRVLWRVLVTAMLVTLLTNTATGYLFALKNAGGFFYGGQYWAIFERWVSDHFRDPGSVVSLTGALPFYLGYHTPLFLPLALAAGVAIGLQRRFPLTTRLFAFAWAMAGLLIVAWVALRVSGVSRARSRGSRRRSWTWPGWPSAIC
jgi:hypothetical protein